jgi:hypothetical protein
MANKISNGELKQENLIQDAMKFASTMPGLFGAAGAAGGNGGNNSNPDMAGMMNMMASMMGNGGMAGMSDMFNEVAKGQKSQKHSKTTVNEHALKKLAKAKQLKKKLHDRAIANKKAQEDE